MDNLDDMSYLDSIRVNKGTENLKSEFNELYKNNQAKAFQLLNAQNVSFPCLFVLLPQIKAYNSLNKLSWRNLYATRICTNSKINAYNKMMHYVFKWILTTGAGEENLSSDFDEILDKSAAQLLIIYKDKSVLPLVSELIFIRNRKGKYIHDLAWCFFKSKQVDTIPLIANYIRSEDNSDNQLAFNLLNFKPELQPKDKQQQYNNFYTWLDENKNFLYYTEDSMQQTSAPKYWRVNLTSKYLCNSASQNRMAVTPFTWEQQNKINAFETIQDSDKKMLAKYSFRTHNNDLQAWSKFIKSPISEQINIAKAELGDTK